MARKALAKSRRTDAERASEHCLVHSFGCVVTRRMKRPAGGGASLSTDGKKQWQGWGGKVDIFHCDVVGKHRDGSHVYAQVTCGQVEAVRQRRRKLETVPWHETDIVLVLQMVETPDPVNQSRKVYHFRVHHFFEGKWSVDDEAIRIERDWFKAMDVDALPDWRESKSKPPALF